MPLFQFIRSKMPVLSLGRFNFILAVWLACALNLNFFKKALMYSELHGMEAVLWVASLVIVLVSYYFIVIQLISWQWSKKIVAVLLVIIGGLSSYFVNTLGIMITPEQIQNMMQTDSREAFALISSDLAFWVFLFVILPSLVLCFLPAKKENFFKVLLKKLTSIIVTLAVAGAVIYMSYIDFSSLFRGHRDIRDLISPNNVFNSGLSYYKKLSYKPLPLIHYGEDAQFTKIPEQPKLMVLVVGETARAESFSLNGYQRNTNPELSKINDLINFKDAHSCGTATAVSVPCMFSGMPRTSYDSRLASHREGLLDIAQRAGYNVTWIDNNSGCKGACDRVHQYQIPENLKAKYCKPTGECDDEILVDSLESYVSTIPKEDKRPQLVVLHQVGSHGPAYYERTQPQFEHFKPICNTNTIQNCEHQALINTYDNSIVYTDYILSQVIKNLEKNEKYQTGFWYLSDHGESTGENGLYLHGAPYAFAPSQQTHIPMMMWFSQAWHKNNMAQSKCLQSQQTRTVGQDNLFPTMLSLLDIKTHVINPDLNMLSYCHSE